MTRVSEIAQHWFALCRKPPVGYASQAGIGDEPEPLHEGRPDGGTGKTIPQGAGAVLSGTKTLIHNLQLLWFTLLAGLVLAINSIAQCWLIVFPRSSEWRFFFDPDTARLFPSLALTFVAGLAMVFCLGYLLTGLAVNLSSKKDRPVSFFQGLIRAKKYLSPLMGGSVVLALAGIQLFVHPFIVQGELFVHNPRWLLLVDPYSAGLLTSLVLIFVIELLTVFCLVFLLAGLIMSISSKEGNTITFFPGLKKAKQYWRPLAGWSVVVALAGSLLFTTGQYSYLLSSSIWQSLNNVLSQFPFNFIFTTLLPQHLFIGILPSGLQWGFGIALADTLILSAINVLLFTLTLFVVPLLVIERKNLKEAVSGSFTLMKKIWGEVTGCVLCLGTIVFAAMFVFLLFRFSGVDRVWWDAGQMYTSYTPPGVEWIALGLLYVLALSGLVLIVATIGGIATLDLYKNAKIRENRV
jgi:hypothetical protein